MSQEAKVFICLVWINPTNYFNHNCERPLLDKTDSSISPPQRAQQMEVTLVKKAASISGGSSNSRPTVVSSWKPSRSYHLLLYCLYVVVTFLVVKGSEASIVFRQCNRSFSSRSKQPIKEI